MFTLKILASSLLPKKIGSNLMIPVNSSYTPLDQQKLVGGFNPFEKY